MVVPAQLAINFMESSLPIRAKEAAWHGWVAPSNVPTSCPACGKPLGAKISMVTAYQLKHFRQDTWGYNIDEYYIMYIYIYMVTYMHIHVYI